ncbi:MAG: hypothetical protein SGPRY_003004 [Prymnesium sp.]
MAEVPSLWVGGIAFDRVHPHAMCCRLDCKRQFNCCLSLNNVSHSFQHAVLDECAASCTLSQKCNFFSFSVMRKQCILCDSCNLSNTSPGSKGHGPDTFTSWRLRPGNSQRGVQSAAALFNQLPTFPARLQGKTLDYLFQPVSTQLRQNYTETDWAAAMREMSTRATRAAILYLQLGPWPPWLAFILRAAASNSDVTFYMLGTSLPLEEPLPSNCVWLPVDHRSLHARIEKQLNCSLDPELLQKGKITVSLQWQYMGFDMHSLECDSVPSADHVRSSGFEANVASALPRAN